MSNSSLINWAGSDSPRQHSIGLFEQGNSFRVGARSNLSILVNLAPIVVSKNLSSQLQRINIDTFNWSSVNGNATKTQQLFTSVLNTSSLYLDQELVIALASGVSDYDGQAGDAMCGIAKDNYFYGKDTSNLSVNDIYHRAELVAPMYVQSYFEQSKVGLKNSFQLYAGEFPWDQSGEQRLIYRV